MAGTQKLIHEILPVGKLQCNCHVVGDPQSREAVVIDPGDDAARILKVIDRHRLKVIAIVITHTHIDHVMGLHGLRRVIGAPVYMHADDLDLYNHLDQQAAWIGWKAPQRVQVEGLVKEGDAIRWGPFQAQVLHTPGHTPGSICLYVPTDIPEIREGENASARGNARLFSGDTLFAGSIGRTDLWGGSFEEIMRSLKGKLLGLPDDTIVYPGHGEITIIGKERQTNPFLAGN